MPVMGKVYHEFYQVLEHIQGLKGMPADRKAKVVELFEARWNQGFSPLHGAGYALDPEYRTHTFSQEVGFELLGLYSMRPCMSCTMLRAVVSSHACRTNQHGNAEACKGIHIGQNSIFEGPAGL